MKNWLPPKNATSSEALLTSLHSSVLLVFSSHRKRFYILKETIYLSPLEVHGTKVNPFSLNVFVTHPDASYYPTVREDLKLGP